MDRSIFCVIDEECHDRNLHGMSMMKIETA